MAKSKKTEKVREKFDLGTLYQKEPGGLFFFRYQINNSRKSLGLKTKNYETAKEKALKYLPTIRATSVEVLAAHVNEAKSLENPREKLSLSDA